MSLFHPDREGALISFSPVVSMENESADENYPFTAILGSQRYHLGSGTRTSCSDRIRDFGLKGEVEISSEDGEKFHLLDGDAVRLRSRYGSLVREIRLERGLRQGLIFVPIGFNGNDAMQLIQLATLKYDQSECLKMCQVRLEKL
jgi:formate dehydrogenase alpha subunit